MSWILSPALRRFTLLAAFASFMMNVMALAPSLFMLQVYDRVFGSGSMETLTMLVLVVALCLGVMSAMDVLRSRALGWASTVLDAKLGPAVLLQLLQASARPGGAANVYTLRDVSLLRGFLGGGGVLALFDAPWFPIYLAVIALFHPWLGVTALVGAILLFGLIWLNERLTRRGVDVATQKSRQASRFIDASLRNVEVIAGMGMADQVVGRWAAFNDEVLAQQMALARRQAPLQAAVRWLRQALQVAMLTVGAWLVVREHVSPGIMVAGTILLSKALSPIEQLSGGWRSLIEARAAWLRLQAEPIETPRVGLSLPDPRGQLDVERVTYAFPGQRTALIKGVNLSLPAGECLGIVGPSGSGKTTLLRLILGIWRPQSGTVRLDGADIAGFGAAALFRHVGYLPQDVELFSGTVAENIARMGPVDAEQVVAAAQMAGVHELVLRLSSGYETQVGDGGATLSGGQRQRIALARALYGRPRLVLLDEPNSNLDAEGEAALLQALNQARQLGMTVVMVGHRPSMMRSVDRLAVLRDGQVEAFGPRDQVLAKFSQAPAAVTA
ncbi:MAG TPA: type I secretion system permease/ATPase [Burkholderiaceae bacterium]|uniref:type I secretion system permease/ATPase n=1 Tax=Accumulibacter sp. TaxID=2053492 RepID=UPI002BF3120A|nr:type I secretion system permease/ATPase [Accumulibacter sp.]HMW54791.1 type I secretion system permease/ATPase [Accumulibacter sp.]HMX11135.1 type I secretion system permease/ATPase [Burkholderiaceae bacterium]HNB44979.1 type I secretion system permease/ATPase [Burkholderiaceae bacterium]HNG77957.1 type I secretion system permease/ATPase [Burkholderiaceae bacterium]